MIILFFMKPQFRFSLFYNTSATRVQRKWHKCDTNATEWDTNDTSATRVKIFDFDNDTSENIFSHSRISYMTNERPQGEEQFHSKNYLLEIPCSHVKMRLKSIIIIIITLFIVDDFQMYKLKCENYNNLQYIYTYIKIHKS